MEPAKPISFDNQRLTVHSTSGSVKRYRVFAKKGEGVVQLDKDAEIKAGNTLLEAIKSAGLDGVDTKVSGIVLKGSTVTYEDDAFIVKQSSGDAIGSEPAPQGSHQLPVRNEDQRVRGVAPQHLFTTDGKTLPERHNKLTKQTGVIASLFNALKIKSSRYQSLSEVDAVVAEMKHKNGKLRLEGSVLVYSASEVGPKGRKVGEHANMVLSALLGYLTQEVNRHKGLENSAILQRIIENTLTADWSADFGIKHPLFTQRLQELLIKLHDQKIAENGNNAAFLVNSDNIISRLNNDRYQTSPFEIFSMMLEKCNAASPETKKDCNIQIIDTLWIWLTEKSNREKLTFSPGLHDLLTLIFASIKENCEDEQKQVFEIILKNYQFRPVEEPRPVELTIDWPNASADIKTGKMHKNSLAYRQMVQDLASDLSTISTFFIKNALPQNIANKLITRELEKITNFVAREILTPVVGHEPHQQAANMIQFFLDVQLELSKVDKLDPFFRIKAALDKPAVQRLNLISTLSMEYQNRNRLMKMYAASQLNSMAQGVNSLTETNPNYIPFISFLEEKYCLSYSDQLYARVAYINNLIEEYNTSLAHQKTDPEERALRLEMRRESYQELVSQLYYPNSFENQGKVLGVLANAQTKLNYNPILSTAMYDELNKVFVSEEQLFLLSYQFTPN